MQRMSSVNLSSTYIRYHPTPGESGSFILAGAALVMDDPVNKNS